MKCISKSNRPKLRIIERRAMRPLSTRNPRLAQKFSQMRLRIAPIVHVVTGQPALDFPHTMLSLYLLTEGQLDALAHYYDQIVPCKLTHAYPQRMRWDQDYLSSDATLLENCRLRDLERVKIKMRLFAHFVGMKGADTPVWEYEKEVEIFGNKIARRVRSDEASLGKFYRGPMASPK